VAGRWEKDRWLEGECKNWRKEVGSSTHEPTILKKSIFADDGENENEAGDHKK
jgi:hypothetical protein